ncbi:hypothetical protein NDW01_04435 [Actinoallomurus sp. WRP6H-15]|nr:hypothetical protein [Actinoallomurus soli]
MREVAWLLRAGAEAVAGRRRRRLASVAVSRTAGGQLAQQLRALPGHYADRLPARTTRRVEQAAAAGEWEDAVEQAITGLASRAAPVSTAERDQLTELADELGLSGARTADLRTGEMPRPDAGEVAGPWST